MLLLKGCNMELLIVVAMKLANELGNVQSQSFSDFESHPETCLAIITELQTRITGYELADYIKAMTYAVENQRSLTQ
jgi:hypothetical protein